MQQYPQELTNMIEKDGICNQPKEMNYKAGDYQSEAMPDGKVADVFSELNSAVESLTKSNKIKELAIQSLKAELKKAKELETKLAEKEALVDKLNADLDNALDLLSERNERISVLESRIEKGKESETDILDSFAVQTKQLVQTKILLEESKLEVDSLHDEVENDEKTSAMKVEDLLKQTELLQSELKHATAAEENSKKAMDELAFVLKEVATEANQTKEKLVFVQDALENMKKESEELKEKLRNSDMKQRILLEEARKEADLYRNTADRLRLEADESLHAWTGKETGFVECIRIAEDEKIAALEENRKLIEALTEAENMNKTMKQENQKLRDILKQALNEANVANEAASIAKAENSQLKDLLAEKDDALIFITRENENLRDNEEAATENIKELKRLLFEASGKDFKLEDKEQERKVKPQNLTDRDLPKDRKLSNAFSLNLKDLIIHSLHGYAHDQDQKIIEKIDENDEDGDSNDADLLKGSIFDVADSPIAAPTHHHRRKSSILEEDADAINPDELEFGDHIDDVENEKNPKKKKALLRRFGDIIIRRRGVHRRDSSIGSTEGHKKEVTSPVDKKDSSSELAIGNDQGHKKDSSMSD